MKHVLMLTLFLALASCGGSGGGSSNNTGKTITNYEANFVPERGLHEITSEAGNIAEIKIENGQIILQNGGLMKEGKTIVIRVDGNKVYKYVEKKDFENGQVSRTVDLEVNKMAEEIKNFLADGSGRVTGDTFYLNSSGTSDSEGRDQEGNPIRYRTTYSYNAEVNLVRPFCQMKTEAVSNIIVNYNGQEERLDNVKQNSWSSCGETLSREELKSLDLSNIEFCDKTNDSQIRCRANQNMESLTADL